MIPGVSALDGPASECGGPGRWSSRTGGDPGSGTSGRRQRRFLSDSQQLICCWAATGAHVSYTKVNYTDVEPVADAMHFLRDPLDCEQVGVTVLDCDAGWTGKPHDHADEGHEEVYVLVEGAATVEVDGEAVAMAAGDAIRLPPEAERTIHNGDTESTFVLVGAP